MKTLPAEITWDEGLTVGNEATGTVEGNEEKVGNGWLTIGPATCLTTLPTVCGTKVDPKPDEEPEPDGPLKPLPDEPDEEPKPLSEETKEGTVWKVACGRALERWTMFWVKPAPGKPAPVEGAPN